MSTEESRGVADEALARRVRLLAIGFCMVFPLVWCIWMWPFDDALDRSGTPAGGDFPVFYVVARLMAEGRTSAVYDLAVQFETLHRLFPSLARETALPFLYPPFVASAVRPLGALNYGAALAAFTALSVLLWYVAITALRRTLAIFRSQWGTTATWWLVGTPLLWETLLGGQASVWAVVILAVAIAFLSTGRAVGAGMVLALAAYKPNVLALVGLGLVVRHPRLLIGMALAVPLLLLAGVVGAGPESLRGYLTLLRDPAAQAFVAHPPFEKFHALLRTLPWLRAHSSPMLSLMIGAPLAIVIGMRWRRATGEGVSSLAIGALLVIQALFNPYLPVYDLLQLSIAALLLADGLVARFGPSLHGHAVAVQLLLATVLLGPQLSQAVASATGVQLFSVILAAQAIWLARAAARARPEPLPRSVAATPPAGTAGTPRG